MHYEIRSNRDGAVLAWTDAPSCIDPLDIQSDIIDAGYKILFSGTQEEYETVANQLERRVLVSVDGHRAKMNSNMDTTSPSTKAAEIRPSEPVSVQPRKHPGRPRNQPQRPEMADSGEQTSFLL